MKTKQKILGVGLPRTGTSSLESALKILGYNCLHYATYIYQINMYDACVEVRFDYKELCNLYDQPKFIFTTRKFDSWIRSCRAHYPKVRPEWNPFWNEPGKWAEYYEKRHAMLVEMINVGLDPLIFDVNEGDGWAKLCKYLNEDLPNCAYPHENRSIYVQ